MTKKNEVYFLAAFQVTKKHSIKYAMYRTIHGLASGIRIAIRKKADFISIRRVEE